MPATRFLCLMTLCCAAGLSARAQPAESSFSVPAAATPGTTTDVTFFNAPAGTPTSLWTSFPAEATLLPAEGATRRGVRYRLTLPNDAPLGIGAVRHLTTARLDNLQLFMIDDLPSTPRAGDNRSAATAQAIPSLAAVDGAAEPLVSHFFKFPARRGQRIAIEVVAQRLGSRMDPLLRLLDTRGREIAYWDDTPGLGSDIRFAHTFAADGDYIIELRDANYEGSPDHRYRLRVGDFPAVTVSHPLGGKRGSESAFTFLGESGERLGPLPIKLPTDAPRSQFGVKYPNGRSSAIVSILSGDLDEFVAPTANHTPQTSARVPVPASISGHLRAEGSRDFYEFQARKGDRLLLRSRTRSLNSPADLFVRVLNSDGRKLAETKIAEPKVPARNVAPPPPDEGSLEFTTPADGTYCISVEDLTRAGGPTLVYRLELSRATPDFTLYVETDKMDTTPGGTFRIKVTAERRNYGGPIELSLAGTPKGLSAKKGTIAAGKLEGELEFAVSDTAPATTPLAHFTIVGRGKDTPDRTASTAPVLNRLFPRMPFVPPEVDGPIALRIRPAAATTKPSPTASPKTPAKP